MPAQASTESSSSSSSAQSVIGVNREQLLLSPPRPSFITDQPQRSDEDFRRDPFRTPDGSVPGTPRSAASNLFSPPASVSNFSADQGTGTAAQGRASPSFTHKGPSRGSLSAVRHASTATSISIHDTPTEFPRHPQFRDSFMSPPTISRRGTTLDTAEYVPRKARQKRSSMLTGPVEKSWMQDKDMYVRLSYYITYAVAMLGVIGGALRCYFAWRDVPRLGNICLVMQDDFDTFDTENTWMQQVDMGGNGNGEFEMTTNSANNSFVRDGMLYLYPTLTSDVIGYDNVMNGYTYNISGCTSTNISECGAVSNSTAGTVINPVMSARISTVKSYNIRYGKVEVKAKLPVGDWMWPALWMLPVNNTYGPWPQSGEIDIMESRGNGPSYPDQGVNYVRGSLNWGPTTSLNSGWRTTGWWTNRRSTFAEGFHTYTLEWDSKFIRIYVDTRLQYMFDLTFNEPFFERGDFPETIFNDSQYIATPDPWETGTPNVAPFDQPFYLIMNLAVGGTNGWFPDNVGNKPWLDGSLTAMQEFAAAQDTWYATWPEGDDRALIVDSVKMWELC